MLKIVIIVRMVDAWTGGMGWHVRRKRKQPALRYQWMNYKRSVDWNLEMFPDDRSARCAMAMAGNKIG